ncbi:MAG: DUF3332 family protein [Chitinivibrionales bacterium]|nr:DUF3332 family protein [Chitinivibrionales bacterium]
MKRIIIALALAGVIAFNGCIGSFSLTTKLYSWNQKATGDKYVNTAILWVLGAVQVYSATVFIDFVFLNTVEFWSGKNPMAFTGPNKLEKVVMSHGNSYKVTMGNYKITVSQLTGANAGKESSLFFVKETGKFYLDEQKGNPVEVGSLSGDMLNLISPNGAVVSRALNNGGVQVAASN